MRVSLPLHRADDAEPSAPADCWNRIGVFAPTASTCPRLAEVIHCHNCDVFAEAGRSFFARRAPPEYVEEWTSAVTRPKQVSEAQTTSLLVFRLGAEWLALRTVILYEVTEMKRVHAVPHRTDPAFLGVVNIRGQLRLCVSLANLLGIEESNGTHQSLSHVVYTRMVAVERDTDRWVFPVDEIHGVRRFRQKDLHDAPITVSKGKGNFTQGLLRFQEGHVEITERRQGAFAFGRTHVGFLDEELLLYTLRRRFLSGGPEAGG